MHFKIKIELFWPGTLTLSSCFQAWIFYAYTSFIILQDGNLSAEQDFRSSWRHLRNFLVINAKTIDACQETFRWLSVQNFGKQIIRCWTMENHISLKLLAIFNSSFPCLFWRWGETNSIGWCHLTLLRCSLLPLKFESCSLKWLSAQPLMAGKILICGWWVILLKYNSCIIAYNGNKKVWWWFSLDGQVILENPQAECKFIWGLWDQKVYLLGHIV